MSAFEDFIQLELPKRGYLNSDVPQNTIIIRKGAGPRQFDALSIQEGQTLTVDQTGNLVSAPISSLIKKYIATVAVPTSTWVLQHNLNSENVIVQCFDEQKAVLLPNIVKIDDANQITVEFGANQAGTARVIFLD